LVYEAAPASPAPFSFVHRQPLFQWMKSLKDPLDALYRRPGVMIRRAHQISVSLFLEETGGLGITNRQYGILTVLRHRPGIDQITVAKMLGLDRSTAGMVLNKLERDGLVGRVVGPKDRRTRSLKLTPAGERMLDRLAAPAKRAERRVLSAFSPRERKVFLDLLDKFARRFNDTTRVPQMADRPAPKAQGGRKKRN
jgi:DNA-binding MarR family transcriptional regulator